MEKTSGIAHYDIQRLCTEAVERNFRGQGNTVPQVISQASYDRSWDTFTNWCSREIEVQRAVNLPVFGVIGFQPGPNNKRLPFIKLNEPFMQAHGLQWHREMVEVFQNPQIVMNPLIKPNWGVMAKNANMEKGVYHQTMLNIFQVIGELLREHANVEVDLFEFGKFQSLNGQVMYAPLNKSKPQAQKQTVKGMMDIQAQRNNMLPPLQHPQMETSGPQYQMQANMAYMTNNKGQSQLKTLTFKSTGGHVPHQAYDVNDSPTRKFTKPFNEARITSELLGAGDDPMASQQEFSLLANNPKQLMSLSFRRPDKAMSRFPPVIDPFSRTLAAPVSSQRHYLSVSHKIGTNFTPSGKGFYIDVDTRIVRYKDVSETGTKLDIISESNLQPADEAEEYDGVINPQNADPRRINARRVSYNRYRQYVENEISVDVIAPIRQYWLTHIIELIPGDLHAVEKDRIEHLVDTMLNEINKDYFDSVRKSIMDYILKDENEMRRLGIQQVLNQPITWGDDYYKGIEPNEEWKHNVMMARMLMSENLCICSQATLELMRIWREKDYYQTYLVSLPTREEKPVPLAQFTQNQGNQIDKVSNLLSQNWNRSAVHILREELENLDKDQTKTFFDSCAALMSNQVRELVTKSISNYVDFFRQFKKPNGKYPTPEDIIVREYDPDTEFEHTFITLSLVLREDEIDFADNLDDVRKKLVAIVLNMISITKGMPRADIQIANNDKSKLWEIKDDDLIITQATKEIESIISENLGAVGKCLHIYDEFLFLLSEEKRIADFLQKTPFKQEEFKAEIKKYQDTIHKIQKKTPYEMRMSMFLVECNTLNEDLIKICNKQIKTICQKIHHHVFTDLQQNVLTAVRAMQAKFLDKADTSNKLVQYEKYLDDVRNNEKQRIITQYSDMIDWLMMLYDYPIHDIQDDAPHQAIKSVYTQARKIGELIDAQSELLDKQRKEIETKLMIETKNFVDELKEVKQDVEKFKDNVIPKKEEEYNNTIQRLNGQIANLAERMIKINEQEVDLELPVTEYPDIDLSKKQLKPYEELWDLFRDVKKYIDIQWRSNPIVTLIPDDIERDHKRMMGLANKLQGVFERDKIPKPKELAKGVLEKIKDFRRFLPLIRALCTEGMEERHLEQISVLLETKWTGTETLHIIINNTPDLQTAPAANGQLSSGFEQIRQKLEEIADTAQKEFSNRKTLDKMYSEWVPVTFGCKDWGGKSFILLGEDIEILQTILDDHLIKTQTMKGSPFARVFYDEICVWENRLIRTQEGLEDWLKVQVAWMALEPVFSSDDIMKQMAKEGTKFKEVDAVWKAIMKQVNSDTSANSVYKIPRLNEDLKAALAKLEEVQKGLQLYLDGKCAQFPRFYFLSSEELLEILAETKEPLRVQPHLKKCFEGINKLDFDDSKKIQGMYSAEKEHVKFIKEIDPIATKGAVEQWLRDVEAVMASSIRDCIDRSNQALKKAASREAWVTEWQGQAVLAVSMMQWTQDAEEAMKKSGIHGLEIFYDQLNTQMNGIVALVRTNITRLQRATLEALVVLDVHARDVIRQDLIEKQVSDINDFMWQSQLRYYWEKEDLWVRIINSTLAYNYEYLGNSARLVITPLTDRCYRTLCGALFLNYGGAPEGPAGTGKTETVKDLSKALARQCIVFNCSDGLDYKQMAKFFKGLASCGAWSCFDEFNRIDLEVLSVIAQQLQSIQIAVERKVLEFDFEGQIIPIKWTCNCFITMNPGYAGRSELPDNLKALFRSVAMMVPDYGMIAEISLYSFGFMFAKPLSQKITTTYKLCSEQLSSQHHYDYGMRAVKSVITAAGNLKRKYIEEDEQILMLRAIQDVNLAKFLSHDLPLFRNITNDLFPGIVLPEPDYDDMKSCILASCVKFKLQAVPYFLDKIIQLYEMIVVRHGLMVVGEPFAGKTSAMNVLASALSMLKEKGLQDEMKTHIKIINPKSVSMGQLYGNFDEATHDWSDGVLAVWYREMASGMEVTDRRWLVFDGPVDAIWIENMNTVLDDNKKLCLMSGEIIQMSANMNMIFEPMDLAVASPATVSRCGMVYMQPHEMGWRPLYDSWKLSIPEFFLDENVSSHYLPLFDELVDVIFQPCINFIRNECQETTPTNDQGIVQSILRLWTSFLKVFNVDPEKAGKPGSKQAEGLFSDLAALDKKTVLQVVDSAFVFSCCWSLCVTVNTQFRRPFDLFFRKVCNGEIDGILKFQNRKILPEALNKGTIYDYVYFPDKNEWKPWLSLVDKDSIDKFAKDSQVQDIVVTTIDTIRYSYIQEHCIYNEIPTLFVGPTGTGKSVYINNVLLNTLPKEKFNIIQIGFSAQTGSNQVQGIIDQKSDKRRAGIFGPKMFGMKAVIFVDDLNMPLKEKYGAQPPIEILRQLMDQGGWYDLKDNKHPFKKFVDTMVIAAMGPPGGGKSFITPRFQRHFNVVAFALFDDSTMISIFTSILRWYFRTGQFTQEVAALEGKIVNATLQIYKQIQEDLKPTPLKSHYTFNLRDVSKVICGICLVTKREVTTSDQMIRLWAHEATRVFGDRLVNDEDRMWMMNAAKEATRAPFGATFDILFKHLDLDKDGKVQELDEWRGLAFGDIMSNFGMSERPYEELDNKEKLTQAADESLNQYNMMADKPMDLVLFSFAVEHLLRVSRVLKQPGGHALLVGVGGSGRQSLTRLASKITDFEIFQIEIKKNYRMPQFREDIKTLMRNCGGGAGKTTTFIFTDNSIKEEAFLEDINNILNTGEVPNIFPIDEKVMVQDSVRKIAKEENRCPDGTPAQLFSFFVERCKKNLHIVMCFSPIGDSFRTRVRNFPSLVNCTTIDWFSEWPKDALQSVALKFLGEIDMDDTTRTSCVMMVQTFHSTTEQSSKKFLRELKRHYYVTPTSYLELISTFRQLLAEKRQEIKLSRDKYLNGYDCLINTEESVGKMQAELEAKQPLLIQTSKEVEIKAVQVEKEAVAAEAVAAVVGVEERAAQIMADDANAIKVDCETALAEAIPALEAAKEALNAITKNDITEIKTVQNAHVDVVMVMQGVCILLGQPPDSKMDPATQKKVQDWWGPTKKLMNDSDFLKKLLFYDKEALTEKHIKALAPLLADAKFDKKYLLGINKVAANMAAWVIAMNAFYCVNLIVKPKQAQLAIAMGKYEEVMGVLRVKQASLREVQAKVAGLKRNLQETMDYKAQLEADVQDCEQKLIRATKLIQGLGSQKTLWKATSETLGVTFTNLTGDVLISSGMIAYLGAFNSVFRDELADEWVKQCLKKKIPNSGAFSLQRVLGDPIAIRNWTLQGLPSDTFSIENAIIQSKTRRWPLFIDPQGQANKWLRQMGKEQNIRIMKFSDGTYLKYLEACISQGIPVLMENCGEELDPAIEPLLQKSIIKKGAAMTIKIGDTIMDYNKDFKFFMCTKLRNPHYLPEVSTKVTLLNFMITFEGLTDQLLAIVVAKENPDLETKKEQLVLDSARYKNKLMETENQILTVLKESKDILGDASAIEILSAASVLSADIEKKQEIAKVTEVEIDEKRTGYKPIALKTSGLFFCIQDLSLIDPMYQYSLPFFQLLFSSAISDAPLAEELEQRSINLNKEFLSSLYRNICRSLFEKDKMIFSFLLSIKLKDMAKEIDMLEFRFLLTGGVSLGEEYPPKPVAWMDEKGWAEFCRACKMPGFKGFMEHFMDNLPKYKEMADSLLPQEWVYPQSASDILNDLRKLIVLRTIRPDKLVPAISLFVVGYLGQEFISPPPFDLVTIFKDSSQLTPLIFILSPGADPLNGLLKFAETKKKAESCKAVSLGQGQGEKAEAAIKDAQKAGNWVVLQNCHLAVSWMGTLEKVCEEMMASTTTHRDFRLWLTSYPSENFPVSVLQNGVKMTNEAPKGLRSNVSNSFLVDPINNPSFFNGTSAPKKFRKLLFGLCFFHAVIQERRLYGPLGWNIQYQFNETDLRISVRQLSIFVDENPDNVPLEALVYLVGECNYGGRVTEDKDRRTLMVLLREYFTEQIFRDDYTFSPSGIYYAPKHGNYEEYIDYAKSLPQFPEPEIFGFHANAAITKNINETENTLFTVLTCQGTGGGGGNEDQDAIVNALADSILKEVPAPFNVKAAEKKYPVSYEQSMNTVLTQELNRFNGLLYAVINSLKDIKKAIKGEVLLNAELESALYYMLDGKVPVMWMAKSYPSLKPLAGYIKDLKERLEFFKTWQDTTIPSYFWINKFFFTHGFLTGALQNYARRKKIAIDTMDMDFEVLHDVIDKEKVPAPEEGIHVYGMWLEGCQWDAKNRCLGESDPKILYTRCPLMWFKPVTKEQKSFSGIYQTPLYKTTERRGVLATTGHSSNFCLMVHLKSIEPESHWIKRGVAMICTLND